MKLLPASALIGRRVPEIFRSWRPVFLSVMLLAAIIVGALYVEVAQAQGVDGAITGLTLTSDAPGTLTVSWNAASPTPTDYRIDWAKSDQDYQSWKVDEGHKYPAPTATTETIADLEHDTEYKIRMRARYYRGEHEGKSWGGPWATETITVAGEPVETPTPEPVEEEPVEEEPVKKEPGQRPPRDDPAPEDTTPAAGTIETLTATDDDGQLLLTWQAPAAPNADPTDYHLNWVKSAEDYPADTAEAGNAHPTGTTHTLTGLEYDTDYKIRVRARYSDGENAANPWNGPWTETTAQVKLPLPAAPSFINTAITEGQVLLSWSNPSDDSITGYQILRGPKADSLVIIEDDTGSSSTSYTDETPPTGQTHTYGVKARNASGLSPAGTAPATVPAAEEEVLITARHGSTGNTLVSNLGQTAASASGIVGPFVGNIIKQAMPFTTGNNPFGYHLTSVQLDMKRFASGNTNPNLSIRADDGGVPSETVLYTLTTSTAITASWNLVTFATSDQTTLQPNTRYWLHATNTGTISIDLRHTDSNDEDTESNVDWQIGNNRYAKTGDGTWDQKLFGKTRMEIRGHPAPAFLVSNLESPGEFIVFRRETDTDGAKLAQAFSAANNENGTPAEFDFHGVTVLLQSDFLAPDQLADSDILATVHKDRGGLPGDQPSDLVYTLTPPETYTVPRHSGPVTFSAPPGSILSSGITYWVKFEIAADSTFFTGAEFIDFEFATDNNEVQGPTTNNRWSIDNNSLWSPETLSWTLEVKSIKISVLGTPHYDTLVSNIDQPSPGIQIVTPVTQAAQSFHTPSGSLGQQYRLSSVRIIARSQTPTQATVDLHADHNGTPSGHLASFTTPGDFAPGSTVKADFIAVAPRDTLLNTDTRYWIVFSDDQNHNVFYIQTAGSTTEDIASLDDWTIGDKRVRKDGTAAWLPIRSPIRMELLGTPFIRTNESDGPDLPGAGHNAHQTGAVVIPGIVSTGHLTAGLDRDHGHSGDYWWLETQRGHSYRVEVKFGDNPDNDTGGSAWMSFIDPDHDDYPYASGCCEADHNRDDGHTFVHFYRPTDDWNNRYLINVAAFDKLNTGSSTYNGPYTITMTDITGTREFVSNLYQDSRSDLLEVGAARQYAMFFETGHHAAGYQLDRIQTFITHQGSPEFSLYSNTIDVPGTKLCDFRNPLQVQHHVTWSAGPPAISFLAPDCAEVILTPTDSTGILHTLYWIVMEGTNYRPSGMDSYAESAYGPGWRIGDIAVTKTTGSWVQDPTSKIIPISVWLSER